MHDDDILTRVYYNFTVSSSSIGTTNLSWVSACSPVVEHSQQEGFTEYRCQRHVKHPTWRRTRDLERSNFRHKRPPASEATLANLAEEGGTMGEKWPRNFAESDDFHVLLHAVKHDMGQTALLLLRRKTCWGFFARKIRLLRPGLNQRTWVPKASTLPLDHRSRTILLPEVKKFVLGMANEVR
jgi:hypothetical protein